MNRAGVRWFLPYWVVGGMAWFAVHESGIHATIAGVALGLLTPAAVHAGAQQTFVDRAKHLIEKLLDGEHEDEDPTGHYRHHVYRAMRQVYADSQSPLDHLHHQLNRFVVFLIMPVFALANAGVVIDASVLGDPSSQMVALAVGLGLLVGKPIGGTLFSYVAVRMGIASLPPRIGWGAIAGAGMLAGIGFTMSLFVTLLAFSTPIFVAGAKISILAASILATVCGVSLLNVALREEEPSVSTPDVGSPLPGPAG